MNEMSGWRAGMRAISIGLVIGLIASLAVAGDASAKARPRARVAPVVQAVPANNPGNWVAAADYPTRALREEREGVVGFRLDVDAAGNVANCRVTQSSGHADLDAKTCLLLTERAKFKPAARALAFSSRIRWVIPQDAPVLAATPGSALPTARGAARPSAPALSPLSRGLVVPPSLLMPAPPPLQLAMPAPVLTATEIGGACPSYGMIISWKLPGDTKRDLPNRYLADFDRSFQALYRKGNESDVGPLNDAYRTCLQSAVRLILSDPSYVVANHELTWCDSCKVLFNHLGPHPARMRIIEGLTYLASTDLAQQDWKKAAETIRAGIEQIGTTHDAFVSQADAAYAAKENYASRQASGAGWGTVIGSALGGILFKNPQAASQVGQQRLADIDVQRRTAMTNIAAERSTLFEIPAPGQWSDDGIRVTVPIFSTWASTRPCCTDSQLNYLSFGAMIDKFPFTRIVKVIGAGSYCTGSFVRPRIILTNRHCVIDDQGALRPLSRAEFSYYYNVTEEYKQLKDTYAIKNVVYPPQDHRADTMYDWALLETIEPSRNGWLGFVDPATLIDRGDWRVAVAGYSSDLNDGSQITMDWGCRAATSKGKWYYRCHTWRGASGSPVMLVNVKNMRSIVVGVHAASIGTANAPDKGAAEAWRMGAADPELFNTIRTVWERQKAEDAAAGK